MSMNPKQEPTNEQLDELLRDVQVPRDLKTRLMQIPDQISSRDFTDKTQVSIAVTPPTNTQSSADQSSWWSFVVVAGILGVAAIVATQWLNNSASESRQRDSIATSDSQRDLDESNQVPIEPDETYESESQLVTQDGLEQFQRQEELLILEEQLAQLEIAQLERKLSQIEQANKHHLDPTEVEAMIAAMAPEFSIELGGSESDVRSAMAQVIKQYPGTQGASRAEQFLKQLD